MTLEKASEKMAARAALVDELRELEAEFRVAFARESSNRNWAECKRLLAEWRELTRKLKLAGYQPWGLVIDMGDEAGAV